MLNGLSSEYEPLVMALTYNNLKLSSDEVKTKLIEEDSRKSSQEERDIGGAALHSRNVQRKITKKFKIKCYSCGEEGHKKPDCPKARCDTKVKNNSRKERKTTNSTLLVTAMMTKNSTSDWVIDSGATSHMSMNQEWMSDFIEESKNYISIANNDRIQSNGIGNVTMDFDQYGEKVTKNISNVLYVPNLSTNLLSVSKMTEKGKKVLFDKVGCKIFDESDCDVTGTVEFTASLKNGLYVADQYIDSVRALSAVTSDHERWHKRLGHLNRRGMKMLNEGLVTGVNYVEEKDKVCIKCLEGKQTVQKFPTKKSKRARELLELIHTDISGPMEVSSWGGARYCLIFVDDFSRKVFGYMLKHKNEVLSKFKIFKSLVENQTHKKIKCIRSDNGTEYINSDFKKFLETHGIIHQTTIPYTPQQNGVAERTNRTLIEKTRCMLFDANLSKKYWAEAMNTAIYLKNRSPTAAVKNAVPEGVWSNRNIDLSHLRIFGCRAQVHVKKHLRKKMDPKSCQYMMVGYCENSKGYRLLDIKNPKKIIKARDVVFIESERIHFQDTQQNSILSEECETREIQILSNLNEDRIVEGNLNNIRNDECISEENFSNEREIHQNEITVESQKERRYPERERRPKRYDDMEYSFFAENNPFDPVDIADALSRSDKILWEQAIEEELTALADNGTWKLVDRPEGKNVVKCKWIFKLKKSADGKTQRHEARLVAKGFSQKWGEDYEETFAPVVRLSTIRLLFGLAVENNWKIDHIDITTAFLNGSLQEEIYMEQPPGFSEAKKANKVCKLEKAIYGLKQSARSWNDKINDLLLSIGFKRCSYDSCVYIKNDEGKSVIIALHVDDFYIFSEDKSKTQKLKEKIGSNFKMKDLGEIKECLGMKITRTKTNICLDQKKYIEQILKRFGMEDSKPISTPLEANLKLEKADENDTLYPYQELIGALMYLSVCTRPDISFATSFLSQFNNCHKKEHWSAAKRVLRYLKGTMDYCLCFQKTGKSIQGFVDADWGGCIEDRRSYTGSVMIFANAAISWQSRKQKSVALSTTEAEYMALCEGAKEAVYLKGLLTELYQECETINIYNDNQGANKLVYNPVFHNRTKHISIRYHYVRELAKDNEISVHYLQTEEMPADILTKSLFKPKHSFCVHELGLKIIK